jgi:flavin reductase (DIM6/NTAB) family NADH-FMN oxidoreductase RutF
MRRPWNIVDVPVYSLATYSVDKVNMNICTYVTAISMKPKLYAIGVYYGTQTLENLNASDTAVLQVLSKKNTDLVRFLGKKSGKKTDKQNYLERKSRLIRWKGHSVLKDASAYVELKVMDRKNIRGDHELFWFQTTGYRTVSQDNILMYQDLVDQKIIL